MCADIRYTGWLVQGIPMAEKLEAHLGLSLLLQREGAPNTMIVDGVKEQVMGIFYR